MYDAALFLHLVGVALLIGSVTATLLTTMRIQTAGTVRDLKSLIAGTRWLEAFIIPGLLLIIGPGLYMVSQHGYHGSIPWSAGWVITSLVVTGLLTVMGPTVEAREEGRLKDAIASDSGERPQAELREIQLAPRLIYIVFFGASQVVALLYLMTNRPGLTSSIAACAVAAAASAIAAAIRIRSVRRAANGAAAPQPNQSPTYR